MNIDWQAFRKLLEPVERIVLTSHVRPDCDALGSELAMAGLLRQMGKQVVIVNDSETPLHLEFIDPQKEVKQLGTDIKAEEIDENFDAILVLDTSAWVQLGSMAEVVRQFDRLKIVLDHHVSQDDLTQHVFKDSTCEATGRLVYEAAKSWDLAISPEVAFALFTAIATDTGWFRFPSVTGDTYRCIAELIDLGVRPSEVYENLFEKDRLQRVNLRGRILSSTQLSVEGRLAYSVASSTDFAETDSIASDTEDAINITMAIAGVEVAILFIELPSRDGVKVSFRSRSQIDVAKLASQFGGGGHIAAAGALVNLPLSEVVPKVLASVEEVMG